jgi:NRAMP (natural resistance-associated macrophage protein)-like metal ion transporter
MKKWKLSALGDRIGPGIITGASDDDPSGILTYLQAGVVMGFKALWTALFMLPLMYAIQEMCGRIGFVTDKGLIKLIKDNFPKYVLYPVALVSVLVISINIGADLLAIGVILQTFSGASAALWMMFAAASILLAIIFLSYRRFAGILKWLTISLFCYIATDFFLYIPWSDALKATFVPSISFTKQTALLIAAILGTTISPYLFFWQANEEVEERNETQAKRSLKRFLVTKNELKHIRHDILAGMVFSEIVTWFMLAGANQLNALYGIKEITTFEQAALVLKPLLGNAAYIVFSIGIVGAGLLAIPVLAGAAGYIIAELLGWSEGMDKKFWEAKGFYVSIILAMVLGLGVNIFRLDPVQMLIYAAVFYTIITPPLIFIIMRIANNRRIMKGRTNPLWLNMLGWATFAVTALSAIAYLVSFLE